MCDEESRDISELVPDNVIIYRACKRRIELVPTENRVNEIAFQKMGRLEANKDGLSLERPLRHVTRLTILESCASESATYAA